MIDDDDGAPYRVWVFFPDGMHHLIDDGLDARAAALCAKRQTETVGARLGTTQRIIIEDQGGDTAFQWEYGKGITFPPRKQ